MKKILSLTSVLMLCTVLFSTQLFAQQQECTGFRTQTQGGWGAKPNGNNPGVYLHANFAAAFPGGLTIGCGDNTLTLTSAQAVTDFLPSGSTPSLLPSGNIADPGGSYSNVLAGQLVTAVLNAGFDAYDPNFSSNDITTGDLVIVSGTFAGLTINQLIAEANSAIGGCSNVYALSDLNDALSAFNENYDNGTVDNGYTTCPVPCTIEVIGAQKDIKCYGDNSGSIDITVTGAKGAVSYSWSDGSTDDDRSNLAAGTYSVTVKDEKGCEASASFTIIQPASALTVKRTIMFVTSPEACDGAIKLRISGGTAPYTVLWNDGSTSIKRTKLCKGVYTVTVTDANGCVVVCKYRIRCETVVPQIAAADISSAITRNETVTATVSPNPTRGIVRLSLTVKTTHTAVLNIYDMSGRQMTTQKFPVNTGTNNKTIDISKYSKGLYNIEVIADGKKQLVKVMLQ